MSEETKIKTIEEDANSLYRTQKIKFTSDNNIITPTKTIPLDRIQLQHTLNPKSRQLNEVFKRFSAEQIKKANEDNDEYSKIESWFNSQRNKIAENTATLCFLDFDEEKYPSEEELEFMMEFAYCNSDITTIPFLSKLSIKADNYPSFEKYIKNAIGIIKQLNKKPIMGIIPPIAPRKIPDLIDLYAKNGINSFALDFDGKNPISGKARVFRVLKKLNKNKALDNSYIHGHNIGMRSTKMADVIPAKDILGYGVGINSLGEKRKPFKPNRTFLEQIKINPLNKFRLFDKKTYGYWKGVSVSELDKIWPRDTNLDIRSFKRLQNVPYFQKIFNCEQLSLESNNMRDVINENSEKSLDYIKKKNNVIQEDLKILESSKQKIKK